jgi:hypothetical protein
MFLLCLIFFLSLTLFDFSVFDVGVASLSTILQTAEMGEMPADIEMKFTALLL